MASYSTFKKRYSFYSNSNNIYYPWLMHRLVENWPIDFKNLKNQIGLFNNPKTVLIYPEFLDTLPKKILKSGFSEVIKRFFLCIDRDLWNNISSKRFEDLDWLKIITTSVSIKNNIVLSDPYEIDMRKKLNFETYLWT